MIVINAAPIATEWLLPHGDRDDLFKLLKLRQSAGQISVTKWPLLPGSVIHLGKLEVWRTTRPYSLDLDPLQNDVPIPQHGKLLERRTEPRIRFWFDAQSK